MKRKHFYFLLAFLFSLGWQMNAQITTFPWNEDFENGGAIPSNWSQEYVSGTADFGFQDGGHSSHPAAAHSGSYNAFFYSGNYNSDETKLITPILDLSGLNNPVLSFWHAQADWLGDQDELRVYYRVSNNDPWTLIPGQEYTSSIADWVQENLISLPNPSSTYQIAFDGLSGYGHGVVIDDVMVQEGPSCSPPSNLSASNVTTTSADLSWTAGGNENAWNIEYGPAGFAQGQGTVVNGVTNPYTLTGLSSNTAYDYYVQADCGSGNNSSWVGPYTFATTPACGDTFYDDGGPNGNYSANLNQTLTIYPDNAGDVVTVHFNSFDMEEGWDGMMVYDGPDTNAPIIDSGSTYGRSACPNGAWTGAAGDTYTADGQSFTSTDPSGALTLVFTSDGSVQHAGWEATVTCAPPPACPDPSNLSASNFTSSTADLSWTAGANENAWNIEYGPAGFTQGQGTTVNVTTNPYTLTGLTSRTDYDFYVQADCGGGDTSAWVGPYTWTQPANGDDCSLPIMANVVQDCSQSTPYTLDFSSAISEYLSGCDGFGNYGYWLKITWPASGTLVVNNTGTDVGLVILDACGGNELYCNNNTLGASTSLQSQALSGSDVWLYFWRDNQSGTADICLEEETCPFPTNLNASNITAHQADLSWTENGSATQWNIEYGITGYTQGTGTMVNGVTNNPYTLSGLTPGTSYDYYVQSDCGGGDTSAWVGPYTFTTLLGCGGAFYDDGGPNANYSSNMHNVITIYPDNSGDMVTVTFNSFDMEEGWDGMMVYNGPGTSSPPISSGSHFNRTNCPNGAWTGAAGDPYTADGQSFTSTDPSGALTFVFTSDFSIQHAGWDATVTCNPAPNCNAIVPDYSQDFMVYKPACWKEAKGNSNSLNYVNSRWTYDGFLNQDISGAARIYMYGTQANINDWLISPAFDLSGGNYELSFKVGITGFSNTGGANMGADDTVKLMYSTDNGATWHDMLTWDANNNPSNMGDPYAIDLSNLSGNSNVMFAYYANTGSAGQGGYNFYVDDFAISTTSCPAASNLNATITSETSVNLSWTDNTSGTATYIVEWKEVNSPTWNNYTTAAGASSYALTGLTPDTEYQWRLTTDCSGSGSGITVTGSNFTPTCIPIVPDYLQEFTTYLDNCWHEAKGTMTSNFPANSRWTNDGFANNGTTGAARIRLYNNAYDSWLISPEFDLSQGSFELTMDIAVTKFSGTQPSQMGPDDEVNVQVSTDGGVTWQVLQVIADANNVPSNQGTQVSIDLSNYTGLTMFAIVASDGSTADLAYNFYVDNFAITNTANKPTHTKPVTDELIDVKVGQINQYFKLSATDHHKMLNVTAYDLAGREIYKTQNVNSENLEAQINIVKGSIIIFRIEMSNHKIITKKSIKM